MPSYGNEGQFELVNGKVALRVIEVNQNSEPNWQTTDVVTVKIEATTMGDNTIVAAQGASKKIVVLNYTLVVSADLSARWLSNTTPLSGLMPLSANGGASPVGSPDSPLIVGGANEALILNISTGQVHGHICYLVK